MTISKALLDKIVVELAKEMPPFDICLEPYAFHKYFAHALLKRVEEEAEVIAFLHDQRFLQFTNGGKKDALKLIALPLVSSEE